MSDALALTPEEALDLRLRQARQRTEQHAMVLAELVHEALASTAYRQYGFATAEHYAAERLGLSYRGVRRLLAVSEAVLRLPDGQREPVQAALVAIGTRKAAVLAPLIGREGTGWEQLVAVAPDTSEATLQEMVTAKTGSRPRGASAPPGDRFLRALLTQIPPDTRGRVEAVFRALMRAGDMTNSTAAFLVMVDLAVRDLADAGVEVEEADAPS